MKKTTSTKTGFAFLLMLALMMANVVAKAQCNPDLTPPTITCAANVTINNTPGLCTGTTTLTAPTVSDNCSSNALNFDGSNDFVSVSSPFTAFTNAITVEWWVNVSTNMTVGSGMGQATASVDNMSTNVWLMHFNGVTSLSFYVNDNGTWRTTLVTPNILANTWYHIAGVCDASGTRIYVNGVLSSTVTLGISSGIVNNVNSQIYFGKDVRYSSSRFGSQSIDEVRIWNVARTQAQIQASMNLELTAQAGLVELYHFNQGNAGGNNSASPGPAITTLTDASGNNRNGTLSNLTLTGATSNWVTGTLSTAPTVTNNSPATYPKGNTTVTWTATDASGNTATCNQTVTVVDNQAPTITCPAAITVTANNTGCTYLGAIGTATATDNCTTVNVTGPFPAGPYSLGTTTVTWTATDAAGLTATCTQTVTVVSSSILITSMKSDAAISGAVGTAGITTIPSNCTLLWSPGGQTTNYITNQTPGTYTVTATDANGCTKTKAIIIN